MNDEDSMMEDEWRIYSLQFRFIGRVPKPDVADGAVDPLRLSEGGKPTRKARISQQV